MLYCRHALARYLHPARPRTRMAFDSTIIHWPTISAFTAYLQGVPRPAWCHGITNHNTYIPNEHQWRGLASMKSMQATYVGKGWGAGPHLYLCAEAPNAADTGIWQLTPLAHVGIHAGDCNASRLGVENVGDFDARPPTAAQYTLLLAVNRAILEHWGLLPASVSVHNECMIGRTCPGKYLTGTQIRASLSGPWPRPTPPPAKHYRVRGGLPVYEAANRQGKLWGFLVPDEKVTIDDLATGHLEDGRGFVDTNGLVAL